MYLNDWEAVKRVRRRRLTGLMDLPPLLLSGEGTAGVVRSVSWTFSGSNAWSPITFLRIFDMAIDSSSSVLGALFCCLGFDHDVCRIYNIR